ncbi:MAG TPA: DJ-1/PfpI family protein [Candidatus Binataceae bacterium]|nr:DJ-1/PfpI family protein [Candidatus Binataceae bacterium]
MQVAILIFDGMTVLDAVGPYEVFQRMPDAEVVFVGETTGLKRNDVKSLALNADRSVSEVTRTDILVVPGGFGEEQVRAKPAMLDWIRNIHATTSWTTSVCTGSLILGAAGLLRGLKATTHWASMDRLAGFGAIPTSERVVEQGKIVTAAGVASGIDMGLRLARKIASDTVAQAIQVEIEYDPQPPFDGSSKHAPAPVMKYLIERDKRRRSLLTR